MKININSVITMENDKNFLVLAATIANDTRYLYLTEVDEAKENLLGNNLIVKEVRDGAEVTLENIEGDELKLATEKLEAIFSGIK